MILAPVIATLLAIQLPVVAIFTLFLGVGAANSGKGMVAFAIPFAAIVACGVMTVVRAYGPGFNSIWDYAVAAIAFAPFEILAFWAVQDGVTALLARLGR